MNTTTRLPVNGIDVGHFHRLVSEAQVADLMDSITRLGLLQPPVVSTAHRLVAGRHRLEAVKRLGWATVPVVVVELSDLQARLASVDENLVRNDLSRLERFEHVVHRAELIAALGQRKRVGRPRKVDTVSGFPKTTDDLAAASGLSGRTLQRASKIVAAIPECVREMLRATPLAESTTELMRLSRLSPDDQMAVAERVVAGERGAVNDLILAVKRKRRATDATRQAALQRDEDAGVHVGRFEELCHVIPDDGVALFLCDPPYADIPLYNRLGRLAARKLKPGGWLVTYCSTHLLAQVVRELGESLTYYWTLAIRCTGVSKQMNGFRVRSGWKPILVFQKPPRTLPPDWLNDFHVGAGNEKDHHHWEQPVEEARFLIERLTDPGNLIADVTCGSGSSLIAAKLAGRRWIGIDADVSAAQVARLRLRESGHEQAPTTE
jgi:ParB-like chromosome segregation protein Spo0J